MKPMSDEDLKLYRAVVDDQTGMFDMEDSRKVIIELLNEINRLKAELEEVTKTDDEIEQEIIDVYNKNTKEYRKKRRITKEIREGK